MKNSTINFCCFQTRSLLIKFILFFLLSGITSYIFAQGSLSGGGINSIGTDEYGTYIDFLIPTGNIQGNDRVAIGGRVKMTCDGVEEDIIAFEGQRFAGNDVKSIYWADKCFISRAKGLHASSWSDIYGPSNTVHGPYDDPGLNNDNTWDGDIEVLQVRWYLLPKYMGKQLSFRITADKVVVSGASDDGSYSYIASNSPQTVQSPLIDATLTSGISALPGKMKVDYSYSGMIGGNFNPDYTITHWLNNDTANTVTDNTNNNTTGSVNIDMSNAVRNVTFNSKFVGKGGYCVYTRSNESIGVDAYQWPSALKQNYNDSSGAVTVSWSIDKLSTNYIKGDEFEVQRSLDPSFPSDGTKIFSVAFDGGTTNGSRVDYLITDNLTSENVHGNVYYRLRRTKSKADWEWNEKRTDLILVNMKLLQPKNMDTLIRLDESGANPKIVLKWAVVNGVWPSGSQFIVRRESNGSSTDISLSDAELRAGTYEDANINTCIEYRYSLFVRPGSPYSATPLIVLPGKVTLFEMGRINNLQASKGYYSDRVELQWFSKGGFSQYLVYRSSTGNFSSAVQIATVPAISTAGSNILYEDTRPMAGIYYTYYVQGVKACGGSDSKTDSLVAIGFRSPTGNIYGRVTYENGQAVENVAVRLQNNSGTLPGQSIYLDGAPQSYLQLDSLYTPFSDTAFSIESWIKPTDNSPRSQVLFSRGGQYEIGFDAAGKLYFTAYGNTVNGTYVNTNQSFFHVAGVYDRDSLHLYLDGEIIASKAMGAAGTAAIDKEVLIGKNINGGNFKGYIDEMRAWNRAVSSNDIKANYTRMMVGNESGMIAYWRFDETIPSRFYDLSQSNGEFNRNDGYMDPAYVIHSTTVPTSSQLALKGITDASGNYMISGVPYTDNGITYTIIPTLGTHKFNPVSVNRLVSSSSNEFTVDFKDNSSFPVSGTIYYRNSTIPAKGVQFKIDGQYAHLQNGDIIETDAAGKFTIYVPVGIHEVKALKASHVFENDGLITDRFGRNLNYQEPVSERILYDSTTIRFIGRVAGGSIQEALPLGHSLSRNNLGEKLSVTLELAGAQNRMINATTADSLVTVNHLLPANQTATRKTRIDYKPYSVVIQPDSITGEFIADLIPENYNVISVKATGHDDLIGNNPVNLDLSDKFNIEKVINNYSDSTNAGDSLAFHRYSDTVFYNDQYKFIYREKPSIALEQINAKGETVDYFGEDSTKTTFFNGNTLSVDVYNDNDKTYLFGYPVFVQNTPYKFKVTAFEEYKYYKESNLVTPASVQKVGTTDGFVSIINNLKDGANTADTFSLNDKGEALYTFYAGAPELGNGIGRKGFSLSIKFGSQVMPWNNGSTQEAYILGGRKTGTDFVTAGPDEVLTILRDPGGSNSYSYYESGTTLTKTSHSSNGFAQSGDIEAIAMLGTEVSTSTGIGFQVTSKVDVINTTGGSIQHEENVNQDHSKTSVLSLLSSIRTSSDPQYVGAEGDLFIGNSTNISYGATVNLVLVKNSEVKASDIVFLNGNTNGIAYSIVERKGIDASQHFGTMFLYPARHIEETLIPNMVKLRNSFLLPKGTSNTDAQQRANNLNQIIYVSKLENNNPNFGKSNGDINAFGEAAKSERWDDGSSYKIFFPPNIVETDTILSLNQSIDNWKKVLEDNEKTKLEASKLVNNYSFTGGSSVDYSEQNSNTTSSEFSKNFVVGGTFLKQNGFVINETGVVLNVKESASYVRVESASTDKDSTSKFGFQLQESGSDYLSIDVLKAADSSFVFKTRGGVTKCPYEGATVTKYYQPGTVIDQPTMQAEVPSISVEEPVVSNIPSSRKASYTVKLFNASDVNSSATFNIRVGDKSNPDGAKIYMDGAELGTGREIGVPSGEALTKTITLERGPSAMDYSNVQIILESTCQSDIADTVLISAHFIPSCSDIHIKSPVDKWVLNTSSPVNDKGDHYLPVTIDQFDINNSLFDHIELQYKPTSSAIWITVMKFYSDTAKYNAAQGEKLKITENGIINYNFVMDATAMSDQNYDVRAVSFCMDNGQVIATTESNLVSGIKDTYNPRLFGNPQPANGILGAEDDIRLNFNEPVAEGLLSNADFQVTGIRNGTPTDHAVSVELDGKNDYIATEFAKNLAAKNITVETWALADGPASGTLFSQGAGSETLEMSITADNYLEVIVGSKTIRSDNPVIYKQGEWAHVAMVLNATTNKVSAYYNFQEVIHDVAVAPYNGTGIIQIGRSISKNGDFFAGKLHELRIWSDVLTNTRLQQNSLSRLSGDENGLLAYYPMTEGKGNVIFDKARGVNATLTGTWSLPPGKAVSLNGNAYVKLNTSFAPIVKDMDYTLELWFKGEPGQTNAALLSNGKGDGTDFGGSNDLFFLGFENGELSFQNNGFKVSAPGNYLDNNWHHVAVAVNRNSGNGQLLVDGVLKKTFDAQNLGGIASAFTYVGARAWYGNTDSLTLNIDHYFKGNIDEIRIWNTYLSQSILAQNNNVGLKGDEFGLLAYYPFNKYYLFQNNQEMGYTLSDMKIQEVPTVKVPDAVVQNAMESDESAPVKSRGPVENLQFNYVVNSDGLIINLLEPRQAIDKTIVTFKAKNIRDKNGNIILSPITWSAYIDRNPLKWSDEELNLSKDAYAPLQFEAQIINHGGSIQKFTLQNLPGWLTASPSSGTLDPKGTQKIVFTVNKGLNVGAYDETVYMLNDNQESEPLAINLKVQGPKPEWSVHPADFKYNMTVYGKIRTQGVFSNNSEDLLAAFVNGKCVGVTNNTYFTVNDNWYALLTVYSDSIRQSNIEFRIWEAATGKTYMAVPSQAVSFVNDTIFGSPRNPVIFDGSEMVFQNTHLNKGWNWISFGLTSPSLNSVSATLANGNWSSGDIVKNEELGFDQFSVNSGWIGYLPKFNNTSLFMLSTANDQMLSTSGIHTDVAKTPIPVTGGRWNYISYLPPVNISLKEALAGYEANDEDVIKSQTGFAMYDSRNGWIGNLTYLEPGKGYMLYRKATSNTSFVYPAITGILTDFRRLPNATGEVKVNEQIPVAGNFNYAENMTVAAVVGNEFPLQKGDRVLAIVNGEIRGESQSISNAVFNKETFFLNIGGEQQQPISFAIERGGEIIAESTTTIGFQTNAIVGTVRDPLVIHVKKVTQGTFIYPNPFHEQVTISVTLSNDPVSLAHEVEMSVYNVSGQLIARRSKESIINGRYTTTWNGKNLNGSECPAGVYFINIKVDDLLKIYKVIKR